MELWHLQYEIKLGKLGGPSSVDHHTDELICCLKQFCDKYGYAITGLNYTGDRHQ